MNTLEIIAACKLERGFDPSAIYCQVTGRPIGFVTHNELNAVIQQILPCDDDTIVDELWTRTMASMRPSPVWNMLRADSLDKMLAHDPKALLAYLMNRLYDPVEKNVSLDERLGILANHLKVWQKIDSIEFTAEDLDAILVVLLTLDARYGLRNHNHPAIIQSFDWALNHVSDHKALIRHLNDWLESLDKRREEAERKALATTRYYQSGNSLVKKAAATQEEKVKPVSKSKAAIIAKQEEKDFFASILDEIMENDSPVMPTPAPSNPPVSGKRRFGVKKDS